MAKYVFLTTPAYGHVNPTLAVAQELVKRGQEVVYYLPEEFADAVQATGAGFRRYQSQFKDIASLVTPNALSGSRLPALLVDESLYVLPQVLERLRAEQPDYIVYEFMCVWARIAAQILKIPAIILRPTYAMNEHFNWEKMVSKMVNTQANDTRSPQPAMPRPTNMLPSNILEMMAKVNISLAELCKTHHIPPIDIRTMFSHSEPLNIIFIPKAFQSAADTFDERYIFVGPSIQLRREKNDFPLEKLSHEQPILYISLGTVFNNQPEFFKMCFEAFAEQPWQVVLSKGKHIDLAALGQIPKNFLVASYVPQLEILARASVFITHCGMNSTMESLYYGVPVIGVPQMFEQAMTARRIAEMGLGLTLEKEAINPTILREAVGRVAHDEAIRERVQKMQQITHEAGGYQRAAEAIIQFSHQHALV